MTTLTVLATCAAGSVWATWAIWRGPVCPWCRRRGASRTAAGQPYVCRACQTRFHR